MTALATSLPTSAAAGASLLANLAIILCVAAVTTVLFQRIRQPVILGYLLAGLIVGPHLPVPLVADEGVAHTLSELGVILLMFALGLEFSLRKLARVAAEAGLIAAIQCGLMIWLGYLVGRAFGWTRLEALFAGAAIAISSTTIIVKAFEEQGIKGGITELVFGILVVEDIVAILLLAILTAFASGAHVSAGQLAYIAGRLGGLLALLLVAGLLIVPRLMRMVVRFGRSETIVVASVGVCFAFAIIAQKLGYSVALGAFLGGALVAESGEGHRIEPLVAPVRDVFAAVFFVAVGMQIDPRLLAQHAWAVVVMTLIVVAGKIVGVTLGAFLAGRDVRTSIQAGMSMAQIGEFSFIIAGVGTSLGATRHFLYPIAVAVSAITTLVTPWLIRGAAPAAAAVDRGMPRAMQTYVSLYGSWVQHLRTADGKRHSAARRTAGLLLADVTVIAAIVVSVGAATPEVTTVLAKRMGMSEAAARLTLLAGACITALPFVYGAFRLARKLGANLAAHAMPARGEGVDLAAAPRRALVVGLQLAILALVGIPFLAAIQPFVPMGPTAIGLGVVLALLAIPFWRSATNLEAHVRAGSQVITELLAAEARSPDHGAHALKEARHLIPGLGEPELVELAAESPAVGKTLKALNMRGLTGATVIALQSAGGAPAVPTGDETLAAGDILVVAGSTDAVRAARTMLGAPALGNGHGQGTG